jgi:hypothetical protein
MAMIRKQIYIASQQDKMLKRLARQTHKTEAEIIRDAIEEHARSLRDKERRMKAWRAIEATVEQRMKLPAVETGRSWKREDLYDRDRPARSVRH